MCDSSTKGLAAQGYVNQLMGIGVDHYANKGTTSFADGDLSDYKPAPLSQTLLVVTADDVPDTINTSRTITVGGPSIVSTIDTIGDQDFYKVELVAGQMYEISHFLKLGGPSGVPLADAYIELYGPDGKLLTNADGGGPNTPQGLDAMLTFTAKVSGTYYINARAYDQAPENGTIGDSVGDYELSIRDVTGRVDTAYKPYYDIDSPLHSLDWGTQVDRTSRNPDGEEGPRVTGNAFSGSSNIFGIPGKNVITVYYAKAGDVFLAENPANPGITATMVAKGLQAWEKAAFEESFKAFEQVADLIFVEVATREEADFKVITYNGTPGVGASVLGRMSAPNTNNEGQAEFNSGDSRWTEAGLQKGGFYFPTLVHEFGHGLGLAHPHDNGGHSSIMRGAGTATTDVIGGGYGDFDLSQQVHTIMSYNDGWSTSPYGQARSGGITGTQVDHFGWVASLSPLDIAVIQDKYGVNEEWATGNNTYVLKDVNAPGTYYESIWDAGGTDEIVYSGARDAVIDLRAATLKYEEGGGGRVSYAFGIHGGFTIANGVTIENARTSAGNDKLIGNDANNTFISGAGNDTLSGGGGDDALYGGQGKDVMTGGAGKDTFLYAELSESAAGADRDVITDFEKGSDKIDLHQLGAVGFIGTAGFSGRAGEVRYSAENGNTVVELDADGDGDADFQVELSGLFQLDNLDFSDLVAGFNDTLTGTSGADLLQGLDGDDVLIGLAGNDTFDGGAGSDTADYSGNRSNFTLDLNLVSAQSTGTTGSDTLISIENLIGGSGANRFFGNEAANTLSGGAGADHLQGNGGDDVLIGGLQKDVLRGGAGSDRFVFETVQDSSAGSNRDFIADFVSGVDKIDLSAIDANSATSGNDAFTFIGSASFTGKAGELRYFNDSTGTILAADVNGDGISDFEVTLGNRAIPLSGDLIL
jgi:Ca2+-binding RTX toxin-like protein